MKSKRMSLIPILALALTVNAAALEVPNDTVVQNLNGSQQVIKTFTVSPETEPKDLIEAPFELEGFRYTFADIVKEENTVTETVPHTETVSVETGKKDLSAILEQLAPTMEYGDGTFRGTLALDHTSIHTEAAGYASGSKTVTDTRTIGPLDRNDMSYIPATTVKDGKTLTLANVEWQVIGTDLVSETLVPSSYQAVATYSGKSTYSYATGYISTAEYVGEVTRTGVESITYRVTYLGEKIIPPETEEEADPAPVEPSQVITVIKAGWPYALAAVGLLAAGGMGIALIRSRRSSQAEDDQEAAQEADQEESET